MRQDFRRVPAPRDVTMKIKSPLAKWRNWQTHRTQNPADLTVHVGSTPTFATTPV
jgi:hypothetical protein